MPCPKKRAHDLGLWDRVAKLLALAGSRRKCRLTMLCARQKIAADVLRERQVAGAVKRCVCECGRAPLAPILDWGIGVDHFRLKRLGIAGEYAVALASRIDLFTIGVWELRCGER